MICLGARWGESGPSTSQSKQFWCIATFKPSLVGEEHAMGIRLQTCQRWPPSEKWSKQVLTSSGFVFFVSSWFCGFVRVVFSQETSLLGFSFLWLQSTTIAACVIINCLPRGFLKWGVPPKIPPKSSILNQMLHCTTNHPAIGVPLIDFYGCSLDFLWISMDFYGFLWISMETWWHRLPAPARSGTASSPPVWAVGKRCNACGGSAIWTSTWTRRAAEISAPEISVGFLGGFMGKRNKHRQKWGLKLCQTIIWMIYG